MLLHQCNNSYRLFSNFELEMLLFLYFITFVRAQVEIDYQLYTNSLGSDYTRVHFPVDENQSVFKLNYNCSFGPLVTEGEPWDEFDIQFLPRTDVSIEKYFGRKEVHPFVALQASAEVNIGDMPREPLLQAANAIVGLSMAPADKFRISAALSKGTGFHSKEDTTGLIASIGLSRPKYGFASSFVKENISDRFSPYKFSAGMYLEKESLRYVLEYDKQFDEEYDPAEISVGFRNTREWNSRDVFLSSYFSFSTSSAPGSAPRVNIGITFNLQKNKKPAFVERKEAPKKEEVIEDEQEVVVISQSSTEEEPKELSDNLDVEETVSSLPAEDDNDLKPKKSLRNLATLNEVKESSNQENTSKDVFEKKEKEDMSTDTTATLTAHEVQPVAPTPESLTNIAQQTGGDSNLAMLLAILAVIGGGTAWKFYSQFAEQKHEQKMKEMELQAKANGLAGASPPPCQTAQAEMKAEIKALKTKLHGTAALLEDVDFDLYDRKLKKLDKRLKLLEDPDEEI